MICSNSDEKIKRLGLLQIIFTFYLTFNSNFIDYKSICLPVLCFLLNFKQFGPYFLEITLTACTCLYNAFL